MIKEIKMPNLGTTADEVRILKWNKKVGDHIDRGELLFEVETDKAAMEVESFAAGYLKKIVAKEGDMIATGGIVAYVGEQDDAIEEAPSGKSCGSPAETDGAGGTRNDAARAKISPMVKKLADKYGVDVSSIKGTGPDGLIMKEDVINAANSKTSGEGPEKRSDSTADTTAGSMPEFVPFSRIGLAVSNAMTRSKTEIPHVYFSIDVDTTSMIKLRSESGKKISYNAMIISTVAKCLRKYPYLAARYNEKGRFMPQAINVGLAVSTGDDLVVPVIKEADEKSLAAVENDIERLVESVKSGNIKQSDITGGVFTVSNLGSYGLSSFTAVINPPEVAILAVAGMIDKAAVINGGIHIRKEITMTLSVDHRVVNGAYAAGFLSLLGESLEKIGDK